MASRSLSGIRGIVTGASSGIGRAIAVQLAGQGAALVLVARRAPELAALAKELGVAGRRAAVVVGDVTDSGVRRKGIATAQEQFGGLDLLVNCAGVSALGRFENASPERLARIMDVNFFAAAEMIRVAVPVLMQGTRPIVVNIGSILGHRGIPRCSEYCASKFALRGLSEAIRPELARHGIDVLLVSPGTTETEFFGHALELESVLWQQQKGVPAELVARRTLAAIRRGKREIVVNPRGKLLVLANRLFPGLIDRLMLRYG